MVSRAQVPRQVQRSTRLTAGPAPLRSSHVAPTLQGNDHDEAERGRRERAKALAAGHRIGGLAAPGGNGSPGGDGASGDGASGEGGTSSGGGGGMGAGGSGGSGGDAGVPRAQAVPSSMPPLLPSRGPAPGGAAAGYLPIQRLSIPGLVTSAVRLHPGARDSIDRFTQKRGVRQARAVLGNLGLAGGIRGQDARYAFKGQVRAERKWNAAFGRDASNRALDDQDGAGGGGGGEKCCPGGESPAPKNRHSASARNRSEEKPKNVSDPGIVGSPSPKLPPPGSEIEMTDFSSIKAKKKSSTDQTSSEKVSKSESSEKEVDTSGGDSDFVKMGKSQIPKELAQKVQEKMVQEAAKKAERDANRTPKVSPLSELHDRQAVRTATIRSRGGRLGSFKDRKEARAKKAEGTRAAMRAKLGPSRKEITKRLHSQGVDRKEIRARSLQNVREGRLLDRENQQAGMTKRQPFDAVREHFPRPSTSQVEVDPLGGIPVTTGTVG